MSKRIQFLRGLAILAVVFIHNTPKGLPQIWCRPFLNFAVGCFLFLSGMLSSADRWHPRKRIVKILIPYAIWTMAYVVLANYRSPSAIPLTYLTQIMTGKAAPIMYYVFVYSELTLLIPLIDRLARSKYRMLGFLISPVELAVFILMPIVMGFQYSGPMRILISLSCLGWFTYFYLGYLLGNGLIKISLPTSKLFMLWCGSVVLQILEGYWYMSMGKQNCGTSAKLTALLTSTVFVMLAYRFLISDITPDIKIIYILGDCSFGIFFSHLAVMAVLRQIPYYSKIVFYPFSALIVALISCGLVLAGKKALGKYAKYLAF